MLSTPGGEGVGLNLTSDIKEILSKLKLSINIENTGGTKIRSMYFDINAVKVKIL